MTLHDLAADERTVRVGVIDAAHPPVLTVASGDEVVLPSPVYFDHDMWLRAEGVEPVHVATGPDFVPDPDALAAAVTPRTRAIVLVTPKDEVNSLSNPPAAMAPRNCTIQ